MMIYVTMLYEI